jgi:CheY-like chemotaxis protein
MEKTRILIAEDYIISSIVMRKLLELWGYEICEQVSSGEDAVDKAGKEKPNLILMDINLHGEINGLEAARQIRTRFGIPIIFTTALSDTEITEAVKIAGSADYFVKPLDFYKLRSVINSIVQN